VLKITGVCGNIFHDEKFESVDKSSLEHLKISREELEKNRLRRETDQGTDIGIILEPGMRLYNGDVLEDNGKMILVEQIPEKVLTVSFSEAQNADLQILVGHIIGNRHRPIAIHDGIVSFPIQSDSELEVFKKLFADVIDKIQLKIEEKIFSPHTGADVHEH